MRWNLPNFVLFVDSHIILSILCWKGQTMKIIPISCSFPGNACQWPVLGTHLPRGLAAHAARKRAKGNFGPGQKFFISGSEGGTLPFQAAPAGSTFVHGYDG
jgi:hypothetical protein